MNENMRDRIFYHIYPLGFCGAPPENDFTSPAGSGLRSLTGQIPRLRDLGINAVYIGPLFESSAHGYDTVDYFWVDRRLGNNEDLKSLVRACHDAGIRVILDAVFNHSGRHFFAFKDIQQKREASPYRDWYAALDFSKTSPRGDSFSYEGWAGCYDLVKFNGRGRAARDHLFEAAEFWIREFDIDGLRLDAAAELLPDFMDELSARCKKTKPRFWLLGEVVGGDYRNWACEGRLDSVTNYELYKGLWSSFNDKNFYELAWTLNRQWGPEGIYRDIPLYNFADNHDVNRTASSLKNRSHLFPLYGILFCLPGVPSLYYGSEYGITGERSETSDRALRPQWNPRWASASDTGGAAALYRSIRDFIRLRKDHPCLREGAYRQIYLSHEQFAFTREKGPEQALVAVNAAADQRIVHIPGKELPPGEGRWRDLLSGEEFSAAAGGLTLALHPSWLRILLRTIPEAVSSDQGLA
jgi:glycosidase